nr:peptidoglycan endopeptidase [Mycobacterium sp. 1164966.3]
MLLVASLSMIAVATLLALVNQVSGTPYIPGGDSPAGTDCSGLASWISNAATDRPVFGSRFNTGNEEAALLSRGFQYGTAPNALVIGWNGGHTAVTLPDGTPVSSGERGGVRIGGAGAYQRGFTHHMFLPMDDVEGLPPVDEPPAPVLVGVAMPAPAPEEGPAPDAPPAPPEPPILVDAAMPPPPGDPAPTGDPDIANT